MARKHLGSTFDSFLEEEGIREEVDLRAAKKIIAGRIRAKMKELRMSRTKLALRLDTSRTVVNRIVDPHDTSITLATLSKVSRALGLKLAVVLIDRQTAKRQRAA